MRKNPTLWPLLTLSLSMLMPSLETSIAHSSLPALARVFDASFPEVQWIVLAYLLVITTVIVSAGRLGDIVGRRRLLSTGILIFTVSSLLCGWASSLGFLIAARAAQGLGAAIMLALPVAFVSETVPKEKIGRAMGLLGTMSAVGTTLGPSLGGALLSAWNWRALFLINVPLGLLNILLVHRYLPTPRKVSPSVRKEIDKVGTLVLALTLAAYTLAMTLGRGQFGAVNIALLFSAAFGVGVFIFTESRATSPLIPLSMFRNAVLRSSLSMNGLVATVMMSTLVVGPFYLSQALGLQAGVLGLVLSMGPLCAALAGIPAGRIVDRWGASSMSTVGLLGMFLGSTLLSLLPLTLGVAGYVIPIMILTSSYALFQAANSTGLMSVVAAEQRGVVSGMLSLSRNLGLMTGASAMGAVFSFVSGNLMSASAEAVAQGMRVTFAIAAALISLPLGARWIQNYGRSMKKTSPVLPSDPPRY